MRPRAQLLNNLRALDVISVKSELPGEGAVCDALVRAYKSISQINSYEVQVHYAGAINSC